MILFIHLVRYVRMHICWRIDKTLLSFQWSLSIEKCLDFSDRFRNLQIVYSVPFPVRELYMYVACSHYNSSSHIHLTVFEIDFLLQTATDLHCTFAGTPFSARWRATPTPGSGSSCGPGTTGRYGTSPSSWDQILKIWCGYVTFN